jgi:large subunit ribosomal protein L46
MNTWVVGNHPVAHHAHGWQKPQYVTVQPNKLVSTSKVPFEQQEFGEKVFFMKARIMAGQADLSRNELGAQDFLWLTKEEIEEKVGKLYWLSIRNMMPAR